MYFIEPFLQYFLISFIFISIINLLVNHTYYYFIISIPSTIYMSLIFATLLALFPYIYY